MHFKKTLFLMVFGTLYNMHANALNPVEYGNEQGIYISGYGNYNFLNYSHTEIASFYSSPAMYSSISGRAGYALGIGYRFSPNFRGDFIAQALPNIPFAVINDSFEKASYNINSYTCLFNGYLALPLNNFESLEPYIMGGVGVATSNITNIDWSSTAQIEFEKNSNQLAWQAGIGSIYRITEDMDFDLSYRYLKTDFTTMDKYASKATSAISSLAKMNHVNNHQASAGLHYRFG